jgi:hypothetical protein
MTRGEAMALLNEHGILNLREEGPIVFNDDLLAMVRERIEAQPNFPASADEVIAAMLGQG